MLPAVVKLCCGISYPHLRSMAGLQRTAVAVIGQELTHLQRRARVQQHTRRQADLSYGGELRPVSFRSSLNALLTKSTNKNDSPAATKPESAEAVPGKEKHLVVQQGQEAIESALSILDDKDGWTVEIRQSNGDVISSKVMPGGSRVFRLEAELEASVETLYDVLFVRVEEMPRWNPSVRQIKVLKHVGPETIVTHEVSAETAGNLIGQRDFLSVRHSRKHESRIYLGGAAIELESFPPQAGFVRAKDGPTCIIIQALDENATKTRFTWLLNMDVKGWLPKSIVNQALPRAQLDFTRHLRRRLSLS